MTVPQPTPDHRTDHRTDSVSGAGTTGGGADPGAPAPRVAWGREIREAVLVALPVAVLTGLPLGLLWLWRAPRVPLVSDGEAVLLANAEGQQAIGADGTFLLLGLAIGAVTGIVVFALRRGGGVAVVLGLVLGALLGSVLAWRLGVWLGPTDDLAGHARSAGKDVVFDGPLEIGARGVLLGLPFAAVATHMFCLSVWGPRDPRPLPAELPHWREPPPGA
ncbi:ABC transporter permease [Streptomyces sp. NBC_01803]|uniref:ABC transporter permease n=1 Tax=Streptomyces sp. NBC_01803 TaxID=2975946 RepID=UPI002DD8413F|nr:ABC transporter permease [Streptomyces sp. NBC_01803]WSA46677.1 ABC transporter permease [Streptomyces sp. NBC_01803]